MIQPSQIQKAVEILARAASPQRIILFGSCARNEANEQSDADFLVVTKEIPDNRFSFATRLRRLLCPLKLPVDIVVHDEKTVNEWADVPGTLIYWILREGKVMYEKA